MAEWSKALDLGSSPSVGVGSNPTSVTLFSISGGLAQSVECVVCNDEAPGSKPGFSTFSSNKGSHSLVVRTPLCGSGNPGSNPGGGIIIARLV